MGNQTHIILVECLREQQMTTLRERPLHSTEFLQKQMITVSHILSYKTARSYMEHDLENNVAG